MNTDFNDAILMMRALVRDAPGEDVDITIVNAVERSFLVVTCSAQMIAHTLAAISNNDAETALDGFEKLVPDIRKQIIRICRAQ